MSSEIAPSPAVRRRNGSQLFFAGWAGFTAFGGLAVMGGHADLSYALFHLILASAICAWYYVTKGKAAPICGAALGTVFFLQLCVFLYSDLFSDEETALKITLGDAFGVVAGILILTGAVRTLRRRPVPGI